MGASVIVTLMVSFLVAILVQTGGGFTRLKLALSLFLVVIISIYLLVFGFFQLVIGLSPATSGFLMKIFWYFNKVLLGTLLVLFAKEMLSQSRWINWLFLWPGVFFALTPLLFIDSDILHSLIDVLPFLLVLYILFFWLLMLCSTHMNCLISIQRLYFICFCYSFYLFSLKAA